MKRLLFLALLLSVSAFGADKTVLTTSAVQTITGAKTFASGKLCFSGSSSGSACLTAPSVASSSASIINAALGYTPATAAQGALADAALPASGLSAAVAGLGIYPSQLGTVSETAPYVKWDNTNRAFLTTLQPPNLSAGGFSGFLDPALAGAGAGNLSNGVYSYKFTYVTANGETTPSGATATVTVTDHTTDGKVTVWWPFPADMNHTKIVRIYRTVANGATWKLHSELDGSLSGAVAIIDNSADGALGANAPTTNTAIEPAFSFAGDGAIKALVSPNLGTDVINIAPSSDDSQVVVVQAQPRQGIGTSLTFYGGTSAWGQAGSVTINGGDTYGEDRLGLGGTYGGSVLIKGGFASPGKEGATGNGGDVTLQPGDASPNEGPGIGVYGAIFLKDAGGTYRIKVDKDGYVLVNVPNSSSGVPSGGLYTTAGALMVKP